jgi:hypothetical protein
MQHETVAVINIAGALKPVLAPSRSAFGNLLEFPPIYDFQQKKGVLHAGSHEIINCLKINTQIY